MTDTPNPGPIEISGGADEHEAAAIAAAIQQALDDEQVRRSHPRRRPQLPEWITVHRSRHPGRPESG